MIGKEMEGYVRGARESRWEIRNGVKDTAETPGIWITLESGATANRGSERKELGRNSPGNSVEALQRARLP